MVTAVVASFLETNAESSRIDLADLSKMCPRRKYRDRYRPTMKKCVRMIYLRIVYISIVDRLKDALIHRVLVVLTIQLINPFWRFCDQNNRLFELKSLLSLVRNVRTDSFDFSDW